MARFPVPVSGTTTVSAGTLELSGTSTLASTSAISVTGRTMLVTSSAANRINDLAGISLNANSTVTPALQFGGTASVTETMGTLSLLGSNTTSIIDLGNLNSAGVGAQLTFNGKGLAGSWTGLLQVWNWTGSLGVENGVDQLDGFSLANFTPAELASIQFYTGSGGSTAIGTGAGVVNGELVPVSVPEPSTLVAFLALVAPIARRKRKVS